jgi:hypothetical protein
VRLKKPYIATLDQVRISREGECGIIEYVEPNVSGVHLEIGPEAQTMTDEEILECHNRILRTQQRMALEYEHIAVEIPEGRPQIKYFALGDQWTPRGDVLRCIIEDGGPDGEAVIHVDDHELSLAEFGRLLTTYAGWGMRIVFVPDDRTYEEPEITICDPNDENE